MADTATYDLIANTTLGSNTSTVTFSSIAASWTDLRIIAVVKTSATGITTWLAFNSESINPGTGSFNFLVSGTSTGGVPVASNSQSGSIQLDSYNGSNPTYPNFLDINIFSYAGSTYKTILSTSSADLNGTGNLHKLAALRRNTAAITDIQLVANGNLYLTGSSFYLYGIKAA